MKITKEFIESGRSEKGGWSKFQLELLGISWPPAKGWKNKVIGNELSEDLARKFLNSKKVSKKINDF
jgi:hypothetical protein